MVLQISLCQQANFSYAFRIGHRYNQYLNTAVVVPQHPETPLEAQEWSIQIASRLLQGTTR
jgi:hypothetical protein